MSPTPISGYEFGEFVLIPSKDLLLNLEKPINVRGKELAILTYMVEHSNKDLSENFLIEAVWGSHAGLAAGNVSHHIAKIRKVLGCNALKPKFIKTLRSRKGYRFIADVKQKEFGGGPDESISSISPGPNGAADGKYSIRAHLFVPVFVGEETFNQIGGKLEGHLWGKYREFKIESGRLCINPSGFGVWHLTIAGTFPTLRHFAAWRRRTYEDVLDGGHVINFCTKELVKSSGENPALQQYLGKLGYVFSTVVMIDSAAKRPETITNVLKVFSNIGSLETAKGDDSDDEHLDQLEMGFLKDGFEVRGSYEFGFPGVDLGFASWDGTSYFSRRHTQSTVEPALVEFEIAVQSLWWMCKCLIEVAHEKGSSATKAVRKYLPEVKRQFSLLKNIAATESPSQRTMVEAVLKTSRVRNMVEAVLDLEL